MSYGQDIVNDTDTVLQGTWEWNGTEYDLVTENIGYADLRRIREYAALSATVESVGEGDGEVSESDIDALQDQAEALEDLSWEDADEDGDWLASVVEEKLRRPEVDPETTSPLKLGAVLSGMLDTWQQETAVANAKADMPIESGN